MNVGNRLFFINILVFDKLGATGQLIESIRWEDLRFELRMKYDWYFTYRAALLQVKYPKYKIEIRQGNYEPVKPNVQIEQSIRNRIMARRRTKSNIISKLIAARATWNEMFPIYENPLYVKAFAKYKRICCEELELQVQLENHLRLNE